MARLALTNVKVTKVTSENKIETSDLIASEAPLQIVLKHFEEKTYVETPISITMRSIGADEPLVIGFLFNEGIINHINEVIQVRYCESVTPESVGNRIIVTLKKSVLINKDLLHRNSITNSSCGVCGKQLITQLMQNFEPLKDRADQKITIEQLKKLPEVLQKKQLLFKHTGGIHACGLFDFEGNLLGLYEDIGRHNALDKVIGQRLIQQQSFENTVIVLSGRVGYEMMQKTAKAKIPVVLAIGAPTSLAVEIAEATGICLIGFAKKDKLNIYTHFDKLK